MSGSIFQKYARDFMLAGGLFVLILLILMLQGSAYTSRMLVEAACYAIIALGLTIQWGYAGLFNIGIMGFIAAGSFMFMFVSFPVNERFWNSAGPGMLVEPIVTLLIGVALIVAVRKLRMIPGWLRTPLTVIIFATTYLLVTAGIDPAAKVIESEAGFIGGFGLPVFVGWAAAGIIAGLIAWFAGRICLGLRSDYLAIATLGIAQIIKTFLKNADWLTNGTLTVSPLPWPVPKPIDGNFTEARSIYLALTAAFVIIIYMLLERAYHAPWGRMMRAIRDNEEAASSMGKDVNKRRLEIFVLGCILMGLGGAMLITFTGLFDPSGFIDLNHTFLIWVMVILGGTGNNRGAILGAILVYIIWVMSEPLALSLFDLVRVYGLDWFGWQAPGDLDSRALQMRVFVIGLTITLVLRFAPEGMLPERIRQD